MVERISKRILNMISDGTDSDEKKEVMLFGITRIVEDIPKYIGILLICILLGVIKELGIVFLITTCYKTFVGGVHLKTNIGCFVGSLIFFLTCIYLPKLFIPNVMFKYVFYVFTYIFAVYVIVTYVPADVPEIPIINSKRRKRDKIMSAIILNFVYIISILLIKNELYSNMIIITMFNVNVMTTRTSYKIFGNEYGYETYIPDELVV